MMASLYEMLINGGMGLLKTVFAPVTGNERRGHEKDIDSKILSFAYTTPAVILRVHSKMATHNRRSFAPDCVTIKSFRS